ncbi:MAG: hypothetical protein BA862_09530 [Desulfobulbaceae bacterium S3730MH12]|nr:MAG: hypothetical protein BA862_09530 [Desulfobulbaceae bacterium S3730MH12]
MKICITAVGNDLSSATESSFGRAPWFLIVDTDSDNVEPVENSSVTVSQGAGIAAAQTIADKQVQALLTGRVGPKAQAALSAAGIKIYEGLAQTTVQQALEQFRQGQFRESYAEGAGNAAGIGCGRGMGGGGGRGCGRGGGAGGGMGQGRKNRL